MKRMRLKHKIGAVFVLMASEFSLLSWAKPQSSQTQSIFGDNFMSGNFHREIENINFDNFEFMPEFDFDGFFKKVETTPKTILEPAQKRFDLPTQDKFDLQSRRHQARSEDAYPEPTFPAPTFPTFPKSSTEGFDFQSRRHQARSEDAYPEPTFPAPTFPTFQRSSTEGLDFQSRRHQARSEDAYSEPEFKNPISSMREDFETNARRNQASSEDVFSEPTFYTNQRYSEIAKPNSVRAESQFQPFPDKLRDMIDEKKSKLENYAYDYEMGESFGADFETPKFDNQKYTLPYESQSIRRLDGPFDPFESELNSEPETSPKGRLIKVKVKKPVMSRSGEAKEESYNGEKKTYTAEKPNWRLPIQPIDPEEKPDYYDPPDREITVGYYEPPVRKVADLNFYEPPPPKKEPLNLYEPPPPKKEPLNFYQPQPPKKRTPKLLPATSTKTEVYGTKLHRKI